LRPTNAGQARFLGEVHKRLARLGLAETGIAWIKATKMMA
jgi:hypothetical protein